MFIMNVIFKIIIKNIKKLLEIIKIYNKLQSFFNYEKLNKNYLKMIVQIQMSDKHFSSFIF